MSASRNHGRSVDREPLAIVGVACRLPGGDGPRAFWRTLASGLDAVSAPSRERLSLIASEGGRDSIAATFAQGGFLEGLDTFDAAFFDLAPREASLLDPQQRLLLELSWEALEDAGIVPATLAGTRTGVFAGVWISDFEAGVYRAAPEVDFYATTGSGRYPVAGRLSYVYDLRGPSLTIDTACSSSLVAVHQACRSVWSGETTAALAGGVNALLDPSISIAYSRFGLLSSRGRCRFADAAADGYVRSDGAGLIVIKPLSRALADGDRVRALILGSAVNNDGRGSGLLVQPSAEGQAAMLREAYRDAGVSPGTIQYVEAHGTGTPVGDPVELDALASVLGEGRRAGTRCAVGSVKTNIGHTEAAAGVAGLIKTVLALEHERLPASLHLTDPTPAIAWADVPLELVPESRPWPASSSPRRAGVSAFGITGTNAHVVLEDHRGQRPAATPWGRTIPMLVSARTPAGLAAAVRSHLAWCRDAANASAFGDACYTAARRRTHHEHRMAVLASSASGAADALETAASGDPGPAVVVGHARDPRASAVFVFPGQGSQWLGMGRGLMDDPVFRDALDRCDAAVRALTGWSVVDEIRADDATSRLTEIDVVQPVLFSMQVALAALWQSWGVRPAAVVGHSMGEVAAAHVSGALTLRDAAIVICRRSALLRRVRGRGAMALVELSLPEAAQAIHGHRDRLSVAVSNATRSTVISGDPDAIDEVIARLGARGVFCRRVKVDVASHSPQVDGLRRDLLDALSDIVPAATTVPFWSTVTGTLTNGASLDAAYWWRNLREPVLFSTTAQHLARGGRSAFVEVSPHPLLVEPLREMGRELDVPLVAVASGRRDEEDRAVVIASASALHCHGVAVDWQRCFDGGAVASLPSYPWQRERFWYASENARRQGRATTPAAPLSSAVHRDTWLHETELSLTAQPQLADHRVRGTAVVPAAAWIDAALDAASARALADVAVRDACFLAEPRRMQSVVRPAQPGLDGQAGERVVQVLTRAGDGTDWTLHAAARVADGLDPGGAEPLERVRERLERAGLSQAHERLMRGRGLEYGPSFSAIESAWVGDDEALARVAVPRSASPGARVSPSLLDACFQALVSAVTDHPRDPLLPVAVGLVSVLGAGARQGWAHARRRRDDDRVGAEGEPASPEDDTIRGDVTLYDDRGDVALIVRDLRLRRPAAPADASALLYEIEWVRRDAATTRARADASWLILGDEPRFASALSAALDPEATRAKVAIHAVDAGPPSAPLPAVNAADPVSVAQWIRAAGPATGLVIVQSPGDEPAAAAGRGTVALLHVAQALAAAAWMTAPRLYVVTRGGQSIGREDVVAPDAAASWGLAGVIAHEHPEWRCTRIDVGGGRTEQDDAATAAELARELASGDEETQIALRSGARWVARLRRADVAPGVVPPGEVAQAFHAVIDTPGVLERVALHARRRSSPAAGHVEIAVEAAGLNFRDVMLAMGLLPSAGANGEARPGLECAGTVVRVGDGVAGVAVGDEVMAIAHGTLASHVVADARFVVPKPQGLDWIQAATFPIVFATAAIALERLARLASGERVLVHSATGGVGLAALQLARRAGAEVIATAGTDEKREYLRSLGVARVYDSRSLEFARDLEADGGGVDVVLNSLAGDAIAAGLATLRPYGRFVEIGKRDIYQNASVGLWPFRRNLSYHALDLERLMLERPDELGAMLHELARRLDAGELTPLPVQAWPMSDAVTAFRTMAQARHIGKLAVTPRDGYGRLPPLAGPPSLRGDATYLVTGGVGALGLAVARWMIEHGATHVRLAGRTVPNPAQESALDSLRALGAEVTMSVADVSQLEDVRRVVADCNHAGAPLRGVVHAAGVLDDGFIVGQDARRCAAVMAGKAAGAWHLHTATSEVRLDFLVLFSSIASVVGTPGQGPYAAANAFLDGLARLRRARGLPACSVNWGPWSTIGLAAAEGRSDRLEAQGLAAIPPAIALEALERVLVADRAQVIVADLDAESWLAAHPSDEPSAFFGELRQQPRHGGASPAGVSLAALDRVRKAAPGRQRREALEDVVCHAAAHVLRLPVERIEPERPLRSLGFDSLMALEFRNRLESAFGIRLSASLVWNYPTIEALVPFLAGTLNLSLDGPVATSPDPAGAPHEIDDVGGLSAREVEALLAAELDDVDDLLRRRP